MFCMWNEVAWCSCKYSCWRLLSVQAQTKMDTLGLESRGFCLLSSFSCADDIIRQCNCWCIFSNLMFKHLRKNAFRWRPYRVECTGSLLTSEVKQRRARSVLGWGTAWEDLRVLSAFLPASFCEVEMVPLSDSWSLECLTFSLSRSHVWHFLWAEVFKND